MRKSKWTLALACALALSGSGLAHASKAEANDLRRQIDSARAAVADLERLDETHRTQGDTTLLRAWLDEADAEHAHEQWDKVRLTLDRCIAQAEFIRQKTIAYRLGAQADERERAARASKDKLERTKKDLADSTTTKKALEMNNK